MREDNKTPVNSGVVGPSRVVHNVHILDASGSMSGGKYTNAIAGINGEIRELKGNTDGNVITNTIIEFSGGGWPNMAGRERFTGNTEGDIHTHCFMANAAYCTEIVGRGANGRTPLNQTVGETIEKLMKHINTGDKVLIKIFTDGQENTSRGIYAVPGVLKKLIKQVEDNHNFTVTFMGTQGDIDTVVRNVGIFMSNTLAHQNTAASIGETYKMSSMSTKAYSKAVARGASTDELKQGFFKGIADDQNADSLAQAGISVANTGTEEDDCKKSKKTK